MLTINKIYKKSGTDKKGRNYDLVTIYSSGKVFKHFDYTGDLAKLQEGDTLDLAGYDQKEEVWQGKTSTMLSRPRDGKPRTALQFDVHALMKALQELQGRIEALETFVFPEKAVPVDPGLPF